MADIVAKREIHVVQTKRMDKTIRKHASFDEMKADEYLYWQSRPVHERVAAVLELTEELYRMKGLHPDAFRLQRTLVYFERAPR
jgi:hypothetical protein